MGGGVEKEGTGVIYVYILYIHINQYHALGLSSFIAPLISFVSYFKNCNSLFSICHLLFTLRRLCKTGIFSVSLLACRLNA